MGRIFDLLGCGHYKIVLLILGMLLTQISISQLNDYGITFICMKFEQKL